MWKILQMSRHDVDLHPAMAELVQTTLRALILTTSGAYLGLQLLVGIFGPEEASMYVFFLAPILAAAAALALYLLPRHMLAATLAWEGGLLLLVTVALWVFRRPEIAFFYAFLPLIASIAAGGVTTLITQGIITALVIAQSQVAPWAILPPHYVFLILIVGVLAGLVGWAASRTLYTVAIWSLQSFAQGRHHLEQVRQHRAQLAQLFKDLDQAYYRLERTNAALIAAWREASEAERFKADFAASLSHELRTPLSLIIGFSEMMLTAPHKYDGIEVPAVYRRDLNAVYQNARHLETLTTDVLDLARLDSGRLPLAREETDIASLVEEAAGMVRDYVVAKGLELKVDLAPGLPALYLDHLRIRQVLLNLLVNAARFTEAGRIGIAATVDDSQVTLRVSDTGRGIPEHELSRVFAEFQQTSGASSLTGWARGTGLGLPISKRLVELHGGSMGVESVYLKGSAFWFTLPLSLAQESDEIVAPSPARTEPRRALPGEKRLLVVVHRDPQVTAALQHYLPHYHLLPATTFEEGLALADEHKAVALLGDIPAGERPPQRDLLFLRCPLPDTQAAARSLGARDLLVKPILAANLWRSIERLGQPVRSVLIADDEPDMVRLLQQILVPRIAARDCYEAYNGEDALALLRAHQPDLVLLDLIMPRMSGYEVLQQMAREPEIASTPVIVVSGQVQEGVDLRALDPLQVDQGGGLSLQDLARAIEGNLRALAPGWH